MMGQDALVGREIEIAPLGGGALSQFRFFLVVLEVVEAMTEGLSFRPGKRPPVTLFMGNSRETRRRRRRLE